MGKCGICDKEPLLPFTCSFCNGQFCIEHRLPENHSCPNAPQRTPLGEWKAMVPQPRLKTIREPTRGITGMTRKCPKCNSDRTMITAVRPDYDSFECLDCRYKWWVPEEKTKTKLPKKAHRNLKAVVILAIVVVIVSMFILNWDRVNWDGVPQPLPNSSDLNSTLVRPISSFTASTYEPFVFEEVVFNGSMSYDPDNGESKGITEYRWYFGDGTVERVNSTVVKHTYREVNTLSVALVVLDDDNQTATCKKTITINWLVPTISQLETWLRHDKTNEEEYVYPTFVCVDFSEMLANHARTQKYWGMGIVYIDGYETTTHEEFNHAINAIITTEGLVYIEPQSDEMWWYTNHEPMISGRVYEFWNYPETISLFVESIEIALEY